MEPDDVDALIERLPPDVPADVRLTIEVTKRVALLASFMQRAVQAELPQLGLNYAEFEVLAALRRTGKPYRMRPNELAHDLFLTTGGTTNVLNRLEVAGLVERLQDPNDARSRQVQLTRDGLRRAEVAVDTAVRIQSELTAGLPEPVMRKTADALREVLRPVAARRRR